MYRGKCQRVQCRRLAAFSAVELLCVIGVIALLVALLVPIITRARARAVQVKCSAALQQIGTSYAAYAAAHDGWWPMARHDYAPPGLADVPPFRTRTKRWHDFISTYVGQSINRDGDRPGEIASLRSKGSSVLWGCPVWDKSGGDSGYAMNVYPTIQPARPFGTTSLGLREWVCRFNVNGLDGWYFRASQWSRSAERCLVYDSISADSSVSGWPWWPGSGPMPPVPHPINFTPDFNRHGRRSMATPESEPSVNVLFCDGHVELLSARRTAYSILFY